MRILCLVSVAAMCLTQVAFAEKRPVITCFDKITIVGNFSICLKTKDWQRRAATPPSQMAFQNVSLSSGMIELLSVADGRGLIDPDDAAQVGAWLPKALGSVGRPIGQGDEVVLFRRSQPFIYKVKVAAGAVQRAELVSVVVRNGRATLIRTIRTGSAPASEDFDLHSQFLDSTYPDGLPKSPDGLRKIIKKPPKLQRTPSDP